MAYIDLTTVKSALGITDTERDAILEQAIAAACLSIDERTGRSFTRSGSATTRVFRTKGRTVRPDDEGYGAELLLVDDIADTDGLVVEVSSNGADWVIVSSTAYEPTPDNALAKNRPITGLLRLTASWSMFRRVRVTAVWGWPAVPDSVKQAALLQAMRLYKRKDSPDGTAGSAEWGIIRVSHIDPDVKALIEPYRLSGFGGGS
ncbi:phage head-tail connector protein [Sphaerisporangium rhizosphaerae]|uniref:Phage head-tail connector protein n=1 Tax=Sphaerisporangium rhizosphaerae TaxID=2269375 RepID=A0ABW2NUJ1_9ACTN